MCRELHLASGKESPPPIQVRASAPGDPSIHRPIDLGLDSVYIPRGRDAYIVVVGTPCWLCRIGGGGGCWGGGLAASGGKPEARLIPGHFIPPPTSSDLPPLCFLMFSGVVILMLLSSEPGCRALWARPQLLTRGWSGFRLLGAWALVLLGQWVGSLPLGCLCGVES
jgi:hypothetical protein